MMVPGSNLLKSALTVISSQTVDYYKFLSRAVNAAGLLVATYDTPIQLKGSLQPVARSMYEQLGLDFTKNYFIFYSSNNILTTDRNVSGDKIVFQGGTYQCESTNNWYGVDGWTGTLCIYDVGP